MAGRGTEEVLLRTKPPLPNAGGRRMLRWHEAWRKGRGKDNELAKESRQQGRARRDVKSKQNTKESKCNQRSL